MALPLQRTRRSFYSQPNFAPVINASADNAAADARANAWNTAAANQFQTMRKAQLSQGTIDTGTGVETQAARVALAKALGYDPTNPPPMDQMKARFEGLSPQIQAAIYAKGGAQFIDPDEGAKMMDDARKPVDTSLSAQVGEMGGLLANGKIKQKVDPKTGKPYLYMLTKDPNDITGLKPEIEQPLTPYQQAIFHHGVSTGQLFNTDNLNNTANPVTDPKARMSEEQFQQVLDQRAGAPSSTPGLSASTAAALVAAKNADLSGTGMDSQANMSLTPYQYGSNMSLTPYKYTNNLSLNAPSSPSVAPTTPTPPSADWAVNLHNAIFNQGSTAALPSWVNQVGPTISNVGDAVGDAASATAGAAVSLANSPINTVNALGRVFGGVGTPQYPTLPNPNDSLYKSLAAPNTDDLSGINTDENARSYMDY